MEFDFSQPVSDLNKVPADFRGLYKQDGDKVVLDVEHVGVKSAVSAITGLNQALKAERAASKGRAAPIDLSPLKEFGDTPDTILAKFIEVRDGLAGQIKNVDVNKIKADLATEYTTKVSKAETRATKAEASFHKRVVVGDAKSAIAQHKGDVTLLLPFVLANAKVITLDDGELDVQVVDETGAVRYSGVTGKPMTVAERVAEMKTQDQYGKLFESEAPNGGGAPAGGASGRPANQQQQQRQAGADASPTDKIRAGLAKGQYQKGK